jgi:biopolymer transport protein ExbD
MAIGSLPESHGEEEEDAAVFAEINITPLTDVFLVLLIIFMVSSTAINSAGVKVNLPKSGAASSSATEKGITVTINASGGVFVGSDEVAMDRLEEVLRGKLSETENKSVILAGDSETLLGSALNVMNLAKKAGAEKFGIATKGQAAPSQPSSSSP